MPARSWRLCTLGGIPLLPIAALLLMLTGTAHAMGGGGGGGGGGNGGGGGGGNGAGDGAGGGMGGGMSGGMSGGGSQGEMHAGRSALGQIMQEVRQRHPGKVLDVRVEQTNTGRFYVFTIMHRNRVQRVRVPLKPTPVQRRRVFNFNRQQAR